MRDLVRQSIESARRSGDRVGVDGSPFGPDLGAEIVRLARLATSIHLADSVRLRSEQHPVGDRPAPVREPAQ